MIFDPKVFVFHSDRNFKHFLAKDLFMVQLVYGI